LKTLEEPPPRTIFVLASTDVHRIPATILSRCQRFDFRPIRIVSLKEHLQQICRRENIAIEPAALEHLARAARGSLRDAESVLDQLRLYSQGEITLVDVQTLLGTAGIEAALELARCLAQRDLAEGLRLIDRLVKDGVDMERLAQAVVEELRGLLLVRAGEPALLELSGDELAEREGLARQLTVPAILQAIERFNVAARETHAHAHPQLPLELALVGSMPQSQKANQEANDPIPSPEPFSGDDPPQNVSPEARLPLVKAGEDDGSAELYELKSRWPQVLELLGRNEAAGLLRSCQPVSVEDSVVTLGFYHTFHLERAEEPQKRALVADVISRVLGRPYRLKLIHKPKARPVEHPLVQEALRMGGRIKKISTDESPTNEEAV
ncbi:MAG: hypothetical protein HYX89_02440, partial [Chloroflexi bacterium]|nr:hypothetical protein [Chloroflexota bacterium]